MGYGDYAPPSGHHKKKPLTKRQIREMQEAFEKGEIIAEHVKILEEQEHKKTKKQIEDDLDSAFL